MERTRNVSVMVMLAAVLALCACASHHEKGGAWNPPAYFAEEHYTEIEGINICYVEAGKENPQAIIFIHGFSGDLQNWWDQYEYFKDKYHVIILDNPGHGKSERRKDLPYSIALSAKVAVGLLDKLGVKKAVVVGNSMGGQIAAYVAINYPERVEKLVLTDSAGAQRKYPLAIISGIASPSVVKVVALGSRKQYPGQDMKSKKREEFVSSIRGTDMEKPYLYALSKTVKSISRTSLRHELRDISVPTLIIWGDNDPLLSLHTMEVFEAEIPQNTDYIVPEGTHTPQMNAPAEFNCAVDKFIQNKNVAACHGDKCCKQAHKNKKKGKTDERCCDQK